MDENTIPNIAVTHGMAEIAPDLRLHYVTAGSGARTVVLLHGFPQTWWEWRHVLPPLVGAGFHVVALDYRGAGHSWRPHGGYDKRTMADDLWRLLRDHLRVTDRIAIVGHDIGVMIGYAFAQHHREALTHLAILDAPIPGTAVFERVRANPRVWHFAFHAARDVAEALVTGRERLYLQAFFNARVLNTAAISDRDIDVYAAAYSAPGAMRAAFELYRAFEQDAADNQEALRRNGKLTIPVLAAWGALSNSGPLLGDMMRDVAEHATGLEITRSGHWIPEENPAALASSLIDFLGPA